MTTFNPAVARVLKRLHYPLDVILMCVRWYAAYPLSLRHIEEMFAERGIRVDHSTMHRWRSGCCQCWRRCSAAASGPLERAGEWTRRTSASRANGCISRPVDNEGSTVDFRLRAYRDKAAACRYFEKSIARNGVPETVTIDKSGANLAALEAINADRETPIRIRLSKYLNNFVEQDHRTIKRRSRSMRGFKSFRCARIFPGGIEVMHTIAKGQMKCAR